MKLVDRYLAQASQFMAADSRSDILEELRSNLEEQVAERAEHAGRNVTEEDEIEVLARLGHPLYTAAEYSRQQYLIGPGLFPLYRHALRVVSFFVLVLYIVFGLVKGLSMGSTAGVIEFVADGVSVLFWVLLVVTGIFVLIEFSGERLAFFERWNAHELRAEVGRPLDYGEQVTNLLTEGVLLLWWNGALVLPQFADIHGAEIWQQLYWSVNVVAGLSFALHTWLVVAGHWTRVRMQIEVVLSCAALALIVTLLFADPLLVWGETPVPGERVEMVVRFALFNIAAFVLWDLWKYGRDLFLGR